MVTGPHPGEITTLPGGGKIASDQECKGREHGQYVGRQLRTGGREEEKYQPRPEDEKQGVTVLMPLLPGSGQAVLHRLDEEGAPGEQAQEHDGNEVPGRMIPAVHRGQVAEEVLLDDVKIEKLRIGPLGQEVPRRRDQQGGDEDADEAFCQDRECGEDVEAPEEKPPPPPPGLAYAREEGEQRS